MSESEIENTHEGCDAADLPQASALDHPADHLAEAFCPKCAHVVEACCPKCGSHVEPAGSDLIERKDNAAASSLAPAEFYRRFATMLQGYRNTKFALGCYLIATGDAYADGVSMAEFAKTWGVTRAAVSKHCRRICAYLQIPPSPYMRKEETARKFKASNRRPTKMTNDEGQRTTETPKGKPE